MSDASDKAAEIRRLMRTEGKAIAENTRGFNTGRYESVSELDDYEALKDEARAIKEDAIERLPALIDDLTGTVEENGGTVYLADDAEDATRYIQQVCTGADAERVVKSKSMTTEEIDANEALEERGIEVVETDLGEWVLQVADEAPSHIVAPAIHRSRETIAELFNDVFADELDSSLETAEELTMFARDQLGDLIEDADVGMTGANFITTDTGTIALVTSEGNARKTVDATDTHIAVAGVEKIVPRVEDLSPFVELIGRSGTGQDITSYISLLTPPLDTPIIDDTSDDDREFHLVLIDNGRMDMREDDQLRETLYCIRCGACANSCANFQSVGGHAFGGETYSGGIATGWEAGVHGLDSADFNDFCTGCTRCVNACPVGIDIPWINTVVRNRINQTGVDGNFDWLVEGLTPDEEPAGLDAQKRFFGDFSTIARLGSASAPLSNRLAGSRPARWAMNQLLGIDPRRELPQFERETLVEWFESRGGRVADPIREAVLYPDVYTNHVQVERGKAAIRTLETLGISVRVPRMPSSGRAPLSQGMITTAEEHARSVADALVPHFAAERDLVVIEPSDLAMFHREYEKLIPNDEYDRLRANSYEIMEYIYGLLLEGSDSDSLRTGDGTTPVAYHSHCQQRTLGLEQYTTSVLDWLGYDVLTSDVECCGMAGSFGYKSEYYELSMDVGDQLLEQFTDEDARERLVLASGTSCLEQLDALLDRSIQHPVELIAPHSARSFSRSNTSR
jgi:iron-sulfur cluster protein